MKWIRRLKRNTSKDLHEDILKDIDKKLKKMEDICNESKDRLLFEELKKQLDKIEDITNEANDQIYLYEIKKLLKKIEYKVDQSNIRLPIDKIESQLEQIEEKISDLNKKINMNEINKKLKKIEKAIKDLDNKPSDYYVKIDKVDIHNPKLDTLTFSLDKIDVKDLSGSLTIGSHIAMKDDKDKKKKEKKEKKDKEEKKKKREEKIKGKFIKKYSEFSSKNTSLAEKMNQIIKSKEDDKKSED